MYTAMPRYTAPVHFQLYEPYSEATQIIYCVIGKQQTQRTWHLSRCTERYLQLCPICSCIVNQPLAE
jgi:hypothetical protein